ncbi:MAG: hypothetical protein JW943_13075 [Deltaproteobacteria bacterium]|nr:hypothetical protein [Deltaproteobacteria bacterium]
MHRLPKKLFAGFIIFAMIFCFLSGCNSSDKAIEQAAGKEDIERYEKIKKKVNTINEQQKEKMGSIPDDENQ